jgi:hypothetical protein
MASNPSGYCGTPLAKKLGIKRWVDVKVCAGSAIWSRLKLVIRKELR